MLKQRVAHKIRNGGGARVVAVPAPNAICCCIAQRGGVAYPV